eukprot:g9992.t1
MLNMQDFLQQMSTFRKRGDCMQKRRGESKLDKADDIREASDVLMEENRKANAREGLQRATWSRSILDLKSAILEAEDAGVDEEEMMEARQMLGVEERKEEARSNLAAATQNRDVEMLEDALEEADRCGLLPTETQLARPW